MHTPAAQRINLSEWRPPQGDKTALTTRISSAESFQQLQAVVAECGDSINGIHIAAAFSRVVRLVRAPGGLALKDARTVHVHVMPALLSTLRRPLGELLP